MEQVTEGKIKTVASHGVFPLGFVEPLLGE